MVRNQFIDISSIFRVQFVLASPITIHNLKYFCKQLNKTRCNFCNNRALRMNIYYREHVLRSRNFIENVQRQILQAIEIEFYTKFS